MEVKNESPMNGFNDVVLALYEGFDKDKPRPYRHANIEQKGYSLLEVIVVADNEIEIDHAEQWLKDPTSSRFDISSTERRMILGSHLESIKAKGRSDSTGIPKLKFSTWLNQQALLCQNIYIQAFICKTRASKSFVTYIVTSKELDGITNFAPTFSMHNAPIFGLKQGILV